MQTHVFKSDDTAVGTFTPSITYNMKPAPLLLQASIFEENEQTKNIQENPSTSNRKWQTDIMWDTDELTTYYLVSFGSADPTKTISAKECSLALTNFYSKLSVLPDHWIPDYRSYTLFQNIQHLVIRGL